MEAGCTVVSVIDSGAEQEQAGQGVESEGIRVVVAYFFYIWVSQTVGY